MKKTAMQLLIDWMEEQNEPSMYQGAIYKATELLETERDQIKEAYDCGHMQGSDRGLGDEFEAQQYYKYTYE